MPFYGHFPWNYDPAEKAREQERQREASELTGYGRQRRFPRPKPINPYLTDYYKQWAMGQMAPKETTDLSAGLLKEYKRQAPEAVYQDIISGLSSPMQRFYGARYGTIYNKYLGDIASTGNIELQFEDWLRNFDFMRDYMGYSPYERGFRKSRYAPSARWLNYY